MEGMYTGRRSLMQVLVPTDNVAGNVSKVREKEGEGKDMKYTCVMSTLCGLV